MTGPDMPITELEHWISIARLRWGAGGHIVTARLQGPWLEIHQDGVYRARIDLTETRPSLQDFADEEA